MKRIMISSLLFLIFFPVFSFGTADAYGWGYKKNTTGEAPEIWVYQEILKKYGAYYLDDTGEKNIYLTFDNGYEEGYTPAILDILKKEAVPGLFFVTGHYVESRPDLVKRMVDEGHIIGNHSYHHPDFSVLTKDAMRTELEDLEAKVAEVSEQKKLKYVRPPRGIFNEQTLGWANDLGYIHVFWSIAFKDWETGNQQGWEYAFEEVMDQVHPGAIILLHTVSKDNAEALAALIKELRTQGYTFKSLDDLVIKDQLLFPVY